MPITLPHQHALRALFHDVTRDSRAATNDNTITPLRDILMVGATFDFLTGIPSTRDLLFLETAMETLAATRTPISYDFRVGVANLDPRFGGEDFLSKSFNAKADVLLMCFLYNREPDCPHTNPVYANSPRHNEPGIWHDKAVETGARAIFAFGNKSGRSVVERGGEVNHTFFERENGRFSTVARATLMIRDEFSLAQIDMGFMVRDDLKAQVEEQRAVSRATAQASRITAR